MSFSVVASARGCFLLFGDNEKPNGSSIFLFTRRTYIFNPLSAGDAFKRIHTDFPQLKFDRN